MSTGLPSAWALSLAPLAEPLALLILAATLRFTQ